MKLFQVGTLFFISFNDGEVTCLSGFILINISMCLSIFLSLIRPSRATVVPGQCIPPSFSMPGTALPSQLLLRSSHLAPYPAYYPFPGGAGVPL